MRQELGPSGARHGDGVGASELEERPENLHCVGSISGGFISRVSPNFARVPEAQCHKFAERRSLWGVLLRCFFF